MSVTAISGDNLAAAGVVSTRDLAEVVPVLDFVQSSLFTIIAIRGIGSFQTNPGADNSVAVYLDGSYTTTKIAGIFDLPDVDNIEVLKGPQGTLWGRNATAGAVLIKTLDPSYTASESFTIGYGMYNDRLAKFFVTAPLIDDKLAGSVAGYYEDMGGYLTNVVTGEHQAGGVKSEVLRTKLMLTPTDNTKFIFSVMYSERIDGTTPLLGYPEGLTFGPGAFQVYPNAITATQPYTYASRLTGAFWDTETVRASLEGTVDTSLGTLTSVAAYARSPTEGFLDATFTSSPDGGYDHIWQPDTTYTEDLNFSTKHFGPVQVQVGASYLHNNTGIEPVDLNLGPLGQTSNPFVYENYRVIAESMAGYLEADTDITDRLGFLAGARYTHEKLGFDGILSFTGVDPIFPFIASRSWNEVTPRASFKYKLADDTNVYISYQRGFKSGAFDYGALSSETVNPEVVDGFEVGIHSDVSRQVTLDFAPFYQKYTNIQVQTLTVTAAPGIYFNGIQNAARARSYGIDADLTYRPLRDLNFGIKLEALRAKYTQYDDAAINAPIPLTQCPPASLPVGCGVNIGRENISGTFLPVAPNLTATFSVDRVMHPKMGDIDFNMNLYITEKFYWAVNNEQEQPGYALLNAKVSWTPNNGPLSFAVWGKNLTSAVYTQGMNQQSGGVLWAPPLTVGAEISGKF
jgi:iron complex outermembrane receptor protein